VLAKVGKALGTTPTQRKPLQRSLQPGALCATCTTPSYAAFHCSLAALPIVSIVDDRENLE
jgi:hypothetical protein